MFKDVYGQDGIKQRLIKAVEMGRVPHAMLFYGGQGVGKLAMAIAFAQYVCCENRKDGDSCGVCPSCVKFNKLIHPDLHFAYPIVRSSESTTCVSYLKEWNEMVLKSPYFTISQWNNAMDAGGSKQSLIYSNESQQIASVIEKKPYEADTKVMIIWMAERFMIEGSNKILKILEEPQGNTLFILITENMEQMLSTIVSRTQAILFPPLPDDVVAHALVSRYSLSPEVAQEYAHVSEGNIIKADEAVESSAQNKLFFDLFVSVMRLAYKRDVKGMRLWTNEVENLKKNGQVFFLQYAQRLLRENFIMNLKQPQLNYMTRDESNFSKNFSAFVTEKNIGNMFRQLALAERQIEQNCNAKMVFFDVALQFAQGIHNR